MLTTSALYKSILADERHTVEWKVTVNGTAYAGDKLAASAGGGDTRPKIGRALLLSNEPAVGECVAGTFECAIFEASSAVPRMATVVPAYRIVLGSSQSEWITLGTFYIDTRSVDKESGALLLTCYDRMLVADGAGGKSYAELTGFSTWPQAQASVASEIASIMGISVDSRTSIGTGVGYMVDYPNNLSMREVLGNIGAANAGNWTITPENKLRLVPLTGGTDTLNVGAAAAGLRVAPALAAWSGVTVWYGDEEAYQAGDDTGRRLACDCPWATQATASGILAVITGKSYQPYTADGAIIDLALELGDVVTVGLPNDTVSGPVFSIRISGGALEQADIEAPGEDEIDHEYPYVDYVDRTLQRKVSLGKSYYGTSISREKGIEIKRSDGKSQALFNSDTFEMDAEIDGVMTPRIYFDPIKGDYVFDGALGADAVFTDSLYAEQGDIAELTVDRLSTSKKVRLYNLGNTQDDNFIVVQDNYLRFTTGSVKYDENDPTTPLTEQATNRYGQNLYWQREPVSYNADGYPLDDDGVQIYATTDETDWPVMVYQYTELIKGQFSFIDLSGVYTPQLILGAGDENGYSKGYLYKEATDLILSYLNSSGDTVQITLGDDGYVDIYQLRRATEMDFSSWDAGMFSETLDGDIDASYLVDFDAQGRPVKIYDADHECEIVW